MSKALAWCVVVASSLVGAAGVAFAEERASVVQDLPEPKRSLVTQSGRLLAAGDADGALAKAEAAVQAEPQSGFAHYCKAEALAALNQHEAAVSAYDSAMVKLPAGDVQARSQAVWGKGLALRASGRCDEARKAFVDYAGMMQLKNSSATSEAEQMATACRSGKPSGK